MSDKNLRPIYAVALVPDRKTSPLGPGWQTWNVEIKETLMNDERVLGAVEAARDAILKHQPMAKPVRNAATAYYENHAAEPGHLLWMCDQIPTFLQEERREKAMRWLGFLQGALWVLRWRTVEAMKTDNAPEGSTIDKERV